METMRVRGYSRSSTDGQVITIEAQEDDIREWCKREGHNLYQMESDPGVKGSRAIEKCDGLQAILNNVRPGDLVVITKIDRLSRDVGRCITILNQLEEIGVRVWCLDGVGNGDTDMDWYIRLIMMLNAELEVRMIRSRTRRAAEQKKRNGSRWGQVPYGRALDEMGPRNESGSPMMLIDDEHQKGIIITMQSMRESGFSLRNIASYLNEQDEPAANGGRWTHSGVDSVLSTQEVEHV